MKYLKKFESESIYNVDDYIVLNLDEIIKTNDNSGYETSPNDIYCNTKIIKYY